MQRKQRRPGGEQREMDGKGACVCTAQVRDGERERERGRGSTVEPVRSSSALLPSVHVSTAVRVDVRSYLFVFLAKRDWSHGLI